MNGNYNDMQDRQERRMSNMNPDDRLRMMGKESTGEYSMMGGRMGNRTMTDPKAVEQVYSEIDNRMARGLCFHEQLADYFCFLGLQGFKRMLEYQYMNECADKRKLHRRYIDMHHRILPIQQVKAPIFIPQSWNNYTTENIDDSLIPKFVKSALAEWKQWEEETKQIYEEAWNTLKNMGLATDAEHMKHMIKDVEKELKKINRLHDTLNGTGYDVNMIQWVQDKYHEKYKKKYHDRFTTKNNYIPYIPPYGDEEYKRMRTRRKIGF